MLDESPPKGFSQWNGKLLAQALLDVSEDHIWRILRRGGNQLQRRRSWCITTDPEFGQKAADVVGLCLNPPEKAVVMPRMPTKTAIEIRARKPIITDTSPFNGAAWPSCIRYRHRTPVDYRVQIALQAIVLRENG